mmetsp:Transcript_2640/g.6816  ORF Transcript_2640/g.6816 Transcript_2640/m.6816 type:complete len:504 (+) Transcript_2640:72-1583(+)
MSIRHGSPEQTAGRKFIARGLLLSLTLFHFNPARFCFTVAVARGADARSRAHTHCKLVSMSSTGVLRNSCNGQLPKIAPSTRRTAAIRQIAVVTDEQVPEAHRGLHNSLYGEESKDAAAAVHGTATDTNLPLHRLPQKMDGFELLDLHSWLQDVKKHFDGESLLLPAVGLYAIYDSSDSSASPLSVGYSRRVHSDLARFDGLDALFVRIRLLGTERRMWTRARLEAAKLAWQAELGAGAVSEEGQSQRGKAFQDSLGKAELEAFQERKWKLQIAMGQRMEEDTTESSHERQEKLRQAVEADDWSGVISQQSEMTRSDTQGSVVTSPFDASAPSDSYSTEGISKELNVESVNAVLEAVRPILVADGGDVEVLGVDKSRGVVTIAMLGACTSCPAAPSTIESGIERCLVEHYGDDVIKEVVRVDAGADVLSDDGMSLAVQGHLGDLEASLQGEGARAEFVPGDDGQHHVYVYGSEMLFQLVKSSLTYRFPEFVGRLKVEKVPAAS